MLRDSLQMIGVLVLLLAFSGLILAAVRLFFYLLERVAERGMGQDEGSETAGRDKGGPGETGAED